MISVILQICEIISPKAPATSSTGLQSEIHYEDFDERVLEHAVAGWIKSDLPEGFLDIHFAHHNACGESKARSQGRPSSKSSVAHDRNLVGVSFPYR